MTERSRSSGSHLELLVDNSILLGEPVDAVIRLSHPPDGSADGVSFESSSHTTWRISCVSYNSSCLTVTVSTCRLVHLGNVDLDTGVVLGRQDPVAGGAFPAERWMEWEIGCIDFLTFPQVNMDQWINFHKKRPLVILQVSHLTFHGNVAYDIPLKVIDNWSNELQTARKEDILIL